MKTGLDQKEKWVDSMLRVVDFMVTLSMAMVILGVVLASLMGVAPWPIIH